MTSGIAFDRPDRLSRLRAFPYDRFKIYVTKLYKYLVGPLMEDADVLCDGCAESESDLLEHVRGWGMNLHVRPRVKINFCCLH